jgi:hypothetical protein
MLLEMLPASGLGWARAIDARGFGSSKKREDARMGTIRDDDSDKDARNNQPSPDAEERSIVTGPQDIPSGFELLGDDGEAMADESSVVPDGPLPTPTEQSGAGTDVEAPQSVLDDAQRKLTMHTSSASLSEETANKLIKLIEAALAKAESLPEDVSPENLRGIVLKTVPAADSAIRDGAEMAAATEADRQDVPRAERSDEASRAVDRFAGGQLRRGEPAGNAATDKERTGILPRVVVVVELANARAIMLEDRRETSKEMASMMEKIAQSKVDDGFWRYENQRRAADYRLR